MLGKTGTRFFSWDILGARMGNRIDVDTSLFPIVRVTPLGTLTDEDYENMFRQVEALWRRGERFMTITDTRKSGTATARQRTLIGEWMKKNAALTERWSMGSIIIVESTIVRGALTAIEWVAQPRVKSDYVGNWEQAVEKARGILARNGMPGDVILSKLRHAG